ncbi:MAG: LysM peptidoglycan-binding domain-containing protein [Calditrichaeota bacterium]|nr:LysM peptidoglycan-binding domain-containing protein [Calditrichota bacterium]
MKFKKYQILKMISVIALIAACQPVTHVKIDKSETDAEKRLPNNLWLSEKSLDRVDSIFTLAKQAHQQLTNSDTLGAELTYEYAFERISAFSEKEQVTLTSWTKYDSVLKLMNTDYERIFEEQEEILEAEEIREEITNINKIVFPDSVLFGNETVIDTSTSGMPITLNKKVRSVIKYFQTKGRKVYTKWLERSGRYKTFVKNVFEEKGLPDELMYLAMIESGFNPRARSYARAVGMWQFISATGRYYGLRHNWWFDERRDFIKATEAAAQHLKDLHERFDGHWYLALAGYNCNPKRVERNMRKYKTNDFWKLRRLPRQTRNYVPTFLAAVIIAKDPKKFGFYIDPQTPFEVDSITVSESIDLNVVAKAVDTTYAFIKEINPAIIRWVTPPGIKNFTLYIPKNSREKFKKAYAQIPDKEKRSWVRHKIRSGESLSTIAAKYYTSISVLKSVNNLRGTRIRAGKYMLIPVPQNKKHYYVSNYSNPSSKSKKRYTKKKSVVKENSAEYKAIDYIVKKGDTLGGIAEAYSTRASKIRSWNGLYYGQNIYPKQKLKVYVRKGQQFSSKKKSTPENLVDDGPYYTVRRGDTLWDIAKKHRISISQLKKINKINGSKIKPGDRLKVQ